MSRTRTSIPESPTEADFLRHWQAAVASVAGDATALAVAGGSVADRLAWVFMSGYQAALLRCFPEFVGNGWSCLAAAEPEGGPGCTLEATGDGFRLTGRKSWIAGARSVESLVISVSAGAGRSFVLVPRHAVGLSITVPREPTFLKELSQGAAAFDGVHVPERHVVADPARARLFRGAEPLYVLVALNACVSAAAAGARNSRLSLLAANALDVGREFAGYLGDWARFDPALDGLKAATMLVVDAVAKPGLKGLPDSLRKSWAADARLFRMFGVDGLL